MMRTVGICIALLAVTLAIPCRATNYYVVASGQSSPTPPWTNWGWAHTNLIEVVARTIDGDTVYVTNNNTYYLTNQVVISRAITVCSWAPGDSLDPTNTILNGNYPNTTNRVFYVNNYGAWIKGFTITNGCFYSTSTVGPYDGGGGVCLRFGHFTNCIIAGNRNFQTWDPSPPGGGGMLLLGSDTGIGGSGSVWNCTISGNTSSNSGGGIKIGYGGHWLIVNCTIARNVAASPSSGGGIHEYGVTGSEIRDCQIVSNSASGGKGGGAKLGLCQLIRCVVMGNTGKWGGGVFSDSSGGLVRNCVIYNNSSPASYGGGMTCWPGSLVQNCVIYGNTCGGAYGGGIAFITGKSYLENCIVWANSGSGTTSNYYIEAAAMAYFTNSCIPPAGGSYAANVFPTNCIPSDPKFAGLATGNVHLQSGSPCVNAGVNRTWMDGAKDMDGLSRIDRFSGQVDMGAYEYLLKGTLFVGR